MSWQKFEAKLALATLFFFHLLSRVFTFWKRSDGLSKFQKNFEADAIYAIGLGERSLLPLTQRCIACSLCTFSCEAIQKGTAPSAFEPKMILLGLSRSGHESEYFLEEWMPCAECSSCTVLCPNEVPIHETTKLIQDRRAKLAFRA